MTLSNTQKVKITFFECLLQKLYACATGFEIVSLIRRFVFSFATNFKNNKKILMTSLLLSHLMAEFLVDLMPKSFLHSVIGRLCKSQNLIKSEKTGIHTRDELERRWCKTDES